MTQISALLTVQRMIQNDRKAKQQDADILHERFRALEQSHMELRRILGTSGNGELFNI